MKEGLDSAERVPILVVLPLDCVGEMFSCVTCSLSRLEVTQELTTAMPSSSGLSLRRGLLSERAPASVVPSIDKGLGQPSRSTIEGEGYDDSVPGEVTKTAPSGDMTI